MLESSEQFDRNGIALVSLTAQIDTRNAMLHSRSCRWATLAAMARDLLVERTRAGLETAGRRPRRRPTTGAHR